MEKEKSTFEQLKEKLPTGFTRIVTERLAEKGIKTSPRNVSYVAAGKSRNQDIEAELLKLLDEKIESEFEIAVKEKLAKLK
ncbi:MAG: hypothetical protein K9J37_13625 [Saprospiraceae bacterium]|nr:hypothetical protein [Saprospiraceae bacterium]MCF8250949.1 hypothetical protein [Saprospiraceae bacterium]MCF8281926.1 hypothetical protein [Bacteroidales bacterium]MCF8311913.1 hypothetical protein [Saprospiraceae bacterium]MCF8441921.1 hypothetical protein [Saprospiraceae bacterium]